MSKYTCYYTNEESEYKEIEAVDIDEAAAKFYQTYHQSDSPACISVQGTEDFKVHELVVFSKVEKRLYVSRYDTPTIVV